MPLDVSGAIGMVTGWTKSSMTAVLQGQLVEVQFIASKSTAFTNGDVMFQLPVGSRPVTPFAVGASQHVGGVPGPCSITAEVDGTIAVYGQSGGNSQVRGSLVFRVA